VGSPDMSYPLTLTKTKVVHVLSHSLFADVRERMSPACEVDQRLN
jgi:hypothetical protein